MARRPDLFQLWPGKKMLILVSIDSLDIHRGREGIGGLQHCVGVAEAWRQQGRVDESGTRCCLVQ